MDRMQCLHARGVLWWRLGVALQATLWCLAAYAGSATGTVNVVNTNSLLGGVFLQLNIPPTFNYEPSCPSPSWAFIPSTDPLYPSLLATMLAAKASGDTITVVTSGCVAISGSAQPRIVAIDYGTRLPGT
jgi:hypothetical protein